MQEEAEEVSEIAPSTTMRPTLVILLTPIHPPMQALKKAESPDIMERAEAEIPDLILETTGLEEKVETV